MMAPARQSEIEVGGATLAVTRQGAGEPVLFVHGSASDQRIWDGQVGAAADRFEAIAYSRRWHRPNARFKAGESYVMEVHADDLEKVIGALDAGPVHLIAHSYGAVVALVVAAQRADLVRSLLLIEPPAFTLFTSDPPRPAEVLRLLARRPALGIALIRLGITVLGPAQKAARKGDVEGVLDVFGPGVLGQSYFDVLPPDRLEQFRDNIVLDEFASACFMPLDPEKLRQVDRPALLICGSASPRIFGLLAREVAAVLPRARCQTIAEASHAVQLDQPEAFNRAMLAFLAEAAGHP